MIDLTFILTAVAVAAVAVPLGALAFMARRYLGDKAADAVMELAMGFGEGAIARLKEQYGSKFQFETNLPEAVHEALRDVQEDAPQWLKRSGWTAKGLSDTVESYLRSRFAD